MYNTKSNATKESKKILDGEKREHIMRKRKQLKDGE